MSASPGSGRWPAGAARAAARADAASPTPDQLQKYVENGCFWRDEIAPEARFYKHANRAYLDYAARMGFVPRAEPITLQLYSEALQKFRLAAEGHGTVQPPSAPPRAHPHVLRPAAVLVSPVRG